MHGPADSMVERLRGLLARNSVARAPAGAGTVIGLLGRGIQLSRSPHMHEQEGARLGLRYTYVLIDFDELGRTAASGPLVVRDGEVLVRWSHAQPDALMPLDRYLADRVDLLAHPPQGA